MTNTIDQQQTVSDNVRLAEIALARDKAKWAYGRAIWVALIASLGVAIVSGIFQYGQKLREAALEDKKFSNALKLEQNKFEFSSALELRQTSNAYLKEFLNEALGVNLERRVKFAEYFATMTEDEGLRARWAEYHNRVEGVLLGKLAEERAKEIEKTAEASKLIKSKEREARLLAVITTLEDENAERKQFEADLAKVREEAAKSQAVIATLQSGIEILKRDTLPQRTATSGRNITVFRPPTPPITPAVEADLPITADNVSAKVGEKHWTWTVFIQAPIDVLSQIRCVEYTLHSSFKNPVVEACHLGSSERAFALNGSGWGTFQIKIRVLLKDGRHQFLTHYLRFR